MDQDNCKLAETIINPSYLRLGQNSINKRDKIMKQILCQRQLPEEPLDDLTIKYFLDSIALMDSNNFDQKIGVGERQSRIYSRIVQERHFYMGHGIGRSGDVMANQPKAAGSSLLLQMTRFLTVSALHELNYEFVQEVLILPLATGMSLSISLLTLSQQQPSKKYVLWNRIDQKTCLKAITTANLIPIVIELKQEGDILMNDLDAMENKIKQLGSENVLAVFSTASCFTPRVPDNICEISVLAKKYKLFHLVNNAYGIWCTKIANSIKQGMRLGQCTVVVQSTDKNFMVPVGGSFLFSNQAKMIEQISGKYPGRASASPILDMFITLLSMGKSTLRQLKKERKTNFKIMKDKAIEFAELNNFRILETPQNTISLGMKIHDLGIPDNQLTELGAFLYSKRVMGHRVIVRSETLTKIGNQQFKNYGSHSDAYTELPYITFACAVGTKEDQIHIFFKRLHEAILQLKKKHKKQSIAKKQKHDSSFIQVKIKKEEQIKKEEIEKEIVEYKIIEKSKQQEFLT